MPTLFACSRLTVIPLLSLCLWAQGISPYPNAITDRELHAKTPMAPPPARTLFHEPDFGSLMVRVTDENSNPKAPGSFFRNPIADANEWSMDNHKFYVSGSNTTLLAYGFDPSTMAISSALGRPMRASMRSITSRSLRPPRSN